jgi:esterase/lipase superfamily enzyme
MRFAWLNRSFLHAVTAIGLIAGPAFGQIDLPGPPKASLLDLTLTPGGSTTPQGDRLEVTVLLYPGTDRVDFELEAAADDVLVQPTTPTAAISEVGGSALDVPPASRPILAQGQFHRGPNGRFRLIASVRREVRGATAVKTALLVPRSSLRLAPGSQLIRYTLNGSVDRVIVFSTTTRLFDVSGIIQTPEPAPTVENTSLPPPEVLFPLTDGRGSNGDATLRPMPTKIGVNVSAPQAPSKTTPAAQYPGAIAPTAPGDLAPPAPAEGPEPQPQTTPGRERDVPHAHFDKSQPFVVLRKRAIYYATNRTVRSDRGTPSERFGNAVDSQVRYGSCLVNIPAAEFHEQGKVEERPWYSGRNPDRYFEIDTTNALTFGAFRDVISPRDRDTRRDILIFIHGYAMPFDYSVMQMAQVNHDIEFHGLPLVFSWPSHGSRFWYWGDETNAKDSVAALTDTLLTVINLQAARPEGARGKIHLIAHSLGNRLTLSALEAVHVQLAAGQKPFGQVVLAAPDVSVPDFVRLVPAVQARAERVTFYFCPQDEALLASRWDHWNDPRAGSGLVPIRALDNIDARKANTSFLGHSYWASAKQLLIDMQILVNAGTSPDNRHYTLEPRSGPARYLYWSFK